MSKFLNNIEIKTAVESLQDADFSWTENVIEKLNADKNLLPEFSKNPEDFVTNMGIKIPDGYHLHYISKEVYTIQKKIILHLNQASELRFV